MRNICLLSNEKPFSPLGWIKDENEIPEDLRKKKIFQHFANMFNSYTKSINKQYDRRGSLFQEHFGRKRITEEKYLRESLIYIHKNPKKHGITNDLERYRYSSYRTIVSENPTLLARAEVLSWFDDKENFIFCHKET